MGQPMHRAKRLTSGTETTTLLAQMGEREDLERGDDALNDETFGIGYGVSTQAPPPE